jgi:[ribosomal protein S5]-alanine N-acetyltransferase
MPDVILAPATRADAAELIRGNLESREHHRPWATPFTDEAGFDAWFGRTLTGPHVGLVAREAASGRVVGVVNLMEIVANPFYHAQLEQLRGGLGGFRAVSY